MSKKDRLLAEKTILARKMKWEAKRPGTTYESSKSFRKSTSSLPSLSKSQTMNDSAGYTNTSTMKPFEDTSRSTFVDTSSPASNDNLFSPLKSSTSPLKSKDNSVSELGTRSMTAIGALRKMHQTTAKAVNAAASAGTLSFGESYFIPKVKLVRPDGASLSDVYESKKNDSWGSILKAQVRESERQDKANIRKKHEADQNFGRVLRDQVFSNSQRMDCDKEIDEKYARIVEESSKKADDVQQKRKADAIRRHKQFIAHAVEDMELKKKQQEEFLRSEIEASTLMICASKLKQEEEEKKKLEMRRLMKIEQERLYEENLESLRRKAEEKKRLHEMDKRMAREAEERAQQEEARREAAKSHKLQLSTEGPVHAINRQIMEAHSQAVEGFYKRNESVKNGLTAQLEASEAAALKRATADSKYLCKDWDYCIHMRDVRKAEEQEFVEKCGREMKNIIRKNIEAEEKRKEDHRKNCLKYQRDLDFQLQANRSRSLAALTETMSPHERALNRKLIEKTVR